jgi:hypothetical protein
MDRNIHKIRATIKSLKRSQARRFTGYLGLSDGTVEVPNRDHYVYIRSSEGGLVEAYNDAVPNAYNLPVWYGFSEFMPTRLHVIAARDVYIDPVYSGVLPHANTHQWGNKSGNDILYVMAQQFMPLNVTASGGFTVSVYPHAVLTSSGFVYADGGDFDLTSYHPTTGARWVLLSVDDDGDIIFKNGSTVATKELLTYSNIPLPDAGTFPFFAVKLYDGQSAIVHNRNLSDLADLRFSGSVSSGGISSRKVVTKTANYTLLSSDDIVLFTATATATLPQSTGGGATKTIICDGAGVVVTVDGDGGDTINNELTQTLYNGDSITLVDAASGEWLVI